MNKYIILILILLVCILSIPKRQCGKCKMFENNIRYQTSISGLNRILRIHMTCYKCNQ